MIRFDDWCSSVDEQVGDHCCQVMTGIPAQRQEGIQSTAAIVPGHYASEEHVARALERLGKPAAAALIDEMLPTRIEIRSGDLGEIYATEWIDTHSGGYQVPIKRLRWKDHPNMAMRGEDVIGMRIDPQSQRLHFLKTEAKSRQRLDNRALTKARESLDENNGRPSPHALSFISARLLELNNRPLADAINDALLKHGIPLRNRQTPAVYLFGQRTRCSLDRLSSELFWTCQPVGRRPPCRMPWSLHKRGV